MAATASNLRDLHELHQRAKALRDRLSSGPKTLATRQAALVTKQTALVDARKASQDAKARLKNKEVQLQGQQAKVDDLTVKLNAVKKNEEYKAIQNQIAHDKLSMAKVEDEILESMTSIEAQAVAITALDVEVKAFEAQITAMKAQIEAQESAQRGQLDELDRGIVEAEAIIPADERERYRRTVKQRGADALAEVDNSACTGCYVSVTSQMVNELINAVSLTYCKTCGRILYLSEDFLAATGRSRR